MTAMLTERPHGYSRYKMRNGCRCMTCRWETAEYAARRLREIEAGTWRPYVEAEPVRVHLVNLAAAGIGYKRVAGLAGLSRSTVQQIRAGLSRRVRPWIADAVLAVSTEPPAPARAIRSTNVDATGTHRRIGALAARGFTLTRQADEIGARVSNFIAIMHQSRVTVRTANAVAAMYERLSMTTPPDTAPARRSKLWAARRGWPPPLAWDDETIDDPAALPEGVPARDPDEVDPVRIRYLAAGKPVAAVTRAERHAAAVALVVAGHTVKEATRRVHLDRRTVNRLMAGATS